MYEVSDAISSILIIKLGHLSGCSDISKWLIIVTIDLEKFFVDMHHFVIFNYAVLLHLFIWSPPSGPIAS